MTKEMTKAFDDFRREMRAELRDIRESVKFCSEVCDNVKQLSDEIKLLREELQHARQKNDQLETENKKLQRKVDELEQYTRVNNLEIKGAPSDEDPMEIVKKLGDAIGEEILPSDIDTCHRIPAGRSGDKSVIVRFVRRDKRNAVLTKARKERPSAKDMGFKSNQPIYVNENLTKHARQLLGSAVAKKRESNWKFVWTNGGKVFARKTESSEILRIVELADVAKMTM